MILITEMTPSERDLWEVDIGRVVISGPLFSILQVLLESTEE